jgi:O-antigen/teichoic acid export membrane protein
MIFNFIKTKDATKLKLTNRLNKSEFLSNVLTLISGTTLSQFIPLAISPILSRLFTPDDFGLLALFVSIVSVISIVATGRYEVAIMLPEKDEDALNIMKLSVTILIITCLILLIVVAFLNNQIAFGLNNEKIRLWLFFVPFSVLIAGLFQNFNYMIIRLKKFKRLAYAKVFQSSTNAVLSLSFGFVGLAGGALIVGNIVGQFVSTVQLAIKVLTLNRHSLYKFNKGDILKLGRRYSDFLKFDIFAGFFSVATPQSIVVLIGIFFSSTLVGIYALTNRVLVSPIYLIAKSVGDVFRQRATEDYNKNGNCRSIYLKTFISLSLLSFPPFLILFLFGEDLFGFIFGNRWIQAGRIAEILAPMFFLKFISSPLSYVFYIAEKQNINLIGQFILFVFTIASIFLGKHFNSIDILFSCICVSYVIIYIAYLVLSYRYSFGNNEK